MWIRRRFVVSLRDGFHDPARSDSNAPHPDPMNDGPTRAPRHNH